MFVKNTSLEEEQLEASFFERLGHVHSFFPNKMYLRSKKNSKADKSGATSSLSQMRDL